MKSILCYGDSNTWGYSPETGERYDHKIRWPCILRDILNSGSASGDPAWWVVEEGLCGRTSCREDPIEGDKNGLRQLIPILKSHQPLDIVIVMLGTNDLKPKFNPTAYDIAAGVNEVTAAILNYPAGPGEKKPKVLMICPPPTVHSPVFADMFGDSTEISKKLPEFFRRFAEESGVEFLDAGKIIQSSSTDGIHLNPENHKKLAETVAEIIVTKMS
jgi:lysophospholipase L1-like esterase